MRVRWFRFYTTPSWERPAGRPFLQRDRVAVALPIELLEAIGADRRLVRRHPKPFAKRDRARRRGRKFVRALKHGELSPG
jgi:hypothetical protein